MFKIEYEKVTKIATLITSGANEPPWPKIYCYTEIIWLISISL